MQAEPRQHGIALKELQLEDRYAPGLPLHLDASPRQVVEALAVMVQGAVHGRHLPSIRHILISIRTDYLRDVPAKVRKVGKNRIPGNMGHVHRFGDIA